MKGKIENDDEEGYGTANGRERRRLVGLAR